MCCVYFRFFFLFLLFSVGFLWPKIFLFRIHNGMNTNNKTPNAKHQYILTILISLHVCVCVPKTTTTNREKKTEKFITPICVVLFSTQALMNINQIFSIFAFRFERSRWIFFCRTQSPNFYTLNNTFCCCCWLLDVVTYEFRCFFTARVCVTNRKTDHKLNELAVVGGAACWQHSILFRCSLFIYFVLCIST